jgi:hypothetical protein
VHFRAHRGYHGHRGSDFLIYSEHSFHKMPTNARIYSTFSGVRAA